jgi:hypothetical protein
MLPSNTPHSQLYTQLDELTRRLKSVLQAGDIAACTPLIAEHQRLMQLLQEAGACGDVACLDMLTQIRNDVVHILTVTSKQRDEIRQLLMQMGKKRQQIGAYTKAQRLV